MHYNPDLLDVVGATLVILGVAFLSRVLKQPHMIGYLAAGIVLGPHGLGIFTDQPAIARLGDIGVLLLLFFIGMETSPQRLAANWRVTLLGTGLQIIATTVCLSIVGWRMGWGLPRSILIGFVVSLSSTALVLNYFGERGWLKRRVGEDALGILLMQDLAVVPMLIVIGFLSSKQIDYGTLGLQVLGALPAVALFAWLASGRGVRLPLGERLRADKELQIFYAFALCLGFAMLSETLRLSTGFGAFVAGLLVGAAQDTEWVQRRLEPFRVVFVALFFVSIGLLVRLDFVLDHVALVAVLTVAVLAGNTLLNAAVFRALGERWRYGLFAGACLAQIGEFSFVLTDVGAHAKLLTRFDTQLLVAVIAGSLMLSPGWIAVMERLLKWRMNTAADDGLALTPVMVESNTGHEP